MSPEAAASTWHYSRKEDCAWKMGYVQTRAMFSAGQDRKKVSCRWKKEFLHMSLKISPCTLDRCHANMADLKCWAAIWKLLPVADRCKSSTEYIDVAVHAGKLLSTQMKKTILQWLDMGKWTKSIYIYQQSRGRCQHITLFVQRWLRMEDGLCSNESDVQHRAESEESQLSLDLRTCSLNSYTLQCMHDMHAKKIQSFCPWEEYNLKREINYICDCRWWYRRTTLPPMSECYQAKRQRLYTLKGMIIRTENVVIPLRQEHGHQIFGIAHGS